MPEYPKQNTPTDWEKENFIIVRVGKGEGVHLKRRGETYTLCYYDPSWEMHRVEGHAAIRPVCINCRKVVYVV